MKQVLSRLGMALCLLLLLTPATLAADTTTTIPEAPSRIVDCPEDHDHASAGWTDLNAKMSTLEKNSSNYYLLPTGNYYLSADLTLNTEDAVGFKTEDNATVALCLNDHTLATEIPSTSSFYTLWSSGTLDIYNCNADGNAATGILRGGTESYPNYTLVANGGKTINFFGGCVKEAHGKIAVVNLNGNLNICGGSFEDCTSNAYMIWVQGTSAGGLKMWSGSISNNTAASYGGAVYVATTATTRSFNLYGGTISGNTGAAGGVYVVADATFNMYGGTISGNTATKYGGGVHNIGTMNLYGGNISGNQATRGGGVYSTGTLNMTGGTIGGGELPLDKDNDYALRETLTAEYGNYCTENMGGGVFNSGTFEMSGTAKVCNNASAAYCGGVMNNGTFNMKGGTVSGNRATTYGGGVMLNNASAVLNLSGGTISGNTAARTSDGRGGGVHLHKGTLNMTGGTISGNTAAKQGGGVCVGWTPSSSAASETAANTLTPAAFTMTGGTITGNTDDSYGSGVYVLHGSFTQEGGTIVGDIYALYGTQTVKDTTGTTSGWSVPYKGTAAISGGYVDGQLRKASSTTITLTGGKFSDDTARSTLADYLSEDKVYSLKDISETVDGSTYVYEVVEGFITNGTFLDLKNDLTLGIYFAEPDSGFTASSFTYSVNGATAVALTQAYDEDTTCYRVFAPALAAKQMTDTVTVSITDGTNVYKYTTSIREAAEEQFALTGSSNYKTLLADMLNYGAAAQKRFNYRKDALANADMSDAMEKAATETAPTWEVKCAGVTQGTADNVAVTVALKDSIELHLYVKDAALAKENVAADGYTVSVENKDTYSIISISGINVYQAKNAVTCGFTTSDGTEYSVTTSISDYVAQALKDAAEETDILTALQKYVEAAISYQNEG